MEDFFKFITFYSPLKNTGSNMIFFLIIHNSNSVRP